MSKIFFSILLFFAIIVSAIFFTPINFIVGLVLNNNKELNIQYSYLDGNFFSGSVLDLYFNEQALGDYSYTTKLSTNDIHVNFLSTDEQDISGNIVKSFGSLDPSIFTIKDFRVEENISLDLIKGINLKLYIEELRIENFQCKSITGSIFINANSIRDELNGDLACREGNKISTNLKNNKNKSLGSIQYHNSSVKVSISTKALPDRRLQLLTDEVSFTIDL